ncbi:hypothetical protein [Allorhodopirellula heiligendammensis]|uniref:Uncharacterized protein n=1 Tax=Allorhodopirellula heiligendammensis TaxID=2714739 RepID=A0A5C6BXV7_9BACT|nr:hypothetical protein [Allorhodopirellula heiligendammensis]TWU16728.1 hypothetical protein Poly21_39340 [Allorhodopirellula heiligendammensis]
MDHAAWNGIPRPHSAVAGCRSEAPKSVESGAMSEMLPIVQ